VHGPAFRSRGSRGTVHYLWRRRRDATRDFAGDRSLTGPCDRPGRHPA
jgi:hypothetical protein